jgi:hypothetical protein
MRTIPLPILTTVPASSEAGPPGPRAPPAAGDGHGPRAQTPSPSSARGHLLGLAPRLWPGCLETPRLFQADTRVRRHRQGFRLYRTWPGGAPCRAGGPRPDSPPLPAQSPLRRDTPARRTPDAGPPPMFPHGALADNGRTTPRRGLLGQPHPPTPMGPRTVPAPGCRARIAFPVETTAWREEVSFDPARNLLRLQIVPGQIHLFDVATGESLLNGARGGLRRGRKRVCGPSGAVPSVRLGAERPVARPGRRPQGGRQSEGATAQGHDLARRNPTKSLRSPGVNP